MRVAAIYRVSTEKQLRRDGDDSIPVQRAAVRAFIATQPGWELVQEYAEEGVSGYKRSAADRDVLQQAMADAKAGKWEALLLFKADRLSRNSLEYPVVLDRFSRLGCQVWSVADAPGGKLLALDTQMDKFVRFLEGWQAETESKNTSIRVSAAMEQLARQGRWSGGPPPYGYRLNPHRRPKSETPALIIAPDEAALIRLMVSLYLDERMGSKRLAAELNEQGYRTPSGRPWDDQRVRRILSNPIIAGLPAYGRPPSGSGRFDLSGFILPRDEAGNLKPVPAYQIVPLERWLALVRAMRQNSATAPHPAPARHGVSAQSRAAGALLTGLLICGHCGARLAADTGRYRLPRRDGSVTLAKRVYYICQTHSRRGRPWCDGQRTYGQKRLEQVVGEQLGRLFAGLGPIEASDPLDDPCAAERRRLRAELRKAERIQAGWLARVDGYLADPDASPYNEAILSAKIREAGERLATLQQRLAKAEEAITPTRPAAATSAWTLFGQAPLAEQKLLLRELIEVIIIRREGIEIRFAIPPGAAGLG